MEGSDQQRHLLWHPPADCSSPRVYMMEQEQRMADYLNTTYPGYTWMDNDDKHRYVTAALQLASRGLYPPGYNSVIITAGRVACQHDYVAKSRADYEYALLRYELNFLTLAEIRDYCFTSLGEVVPPSVEPLVPLQSTCSSTVALPICPPRKQQPGHIVRGLPTPAILSSGEDAADEHVPNISTSFSPLSPLPAAETTTTITRRSTVTTTPPPDPDNPYSDWDPRHAPRNSYFREAKRRAIQEEAASITLQRWLIRRVFIRNINRHLCRRSHTKQLCRGASSYAKELASTGRIKSPAPAPSNNNSTPPSPRMQRYPTAEETHAFRHRGLPLPTLPTKKKKRRKRYKRCIRPPPRNRESSSTSSPTSRLTSLCQVKHPTEGCRHCPAFFHYQKDLEAHLLHVHGETRCLDKVTSTVETAPVSPVDAVLPRNPCSPTPSPAQPSSTTHRPNSSNTNGLGRQKDRVPSTDETPPVSAADANLPQNPYPLQHVSDLLSQLQSALQQLPAETYVAVDKSFLSPKILDKMVAIVTVMLDFFKDRAWGAASHPD